jgi:hypothetical protein
MTELKMFLTVSAHAGTIGRRDRDDLLAKAQHDCGVSERSANDYRPAQIKISAGKRKSKSHH